MGEGGEGYHPTGLRERSEPNASPAQRAPPREIRILHTVRSVAVIPYDDCDELDEENFIFDDDGAYRYPGYDSD